MKDLKFKKVALALSGCATTLSNLFIDAPATHIVNYRKYRRKPTRTFVPAEDEASAKTQKGRGSRKLT